LKLIQPELVFFRFAGKYDRISIILTLYSNYCKKSNGVLPI
jgi:hypothetical protein